MDTNTYIYSFILSNSYIYTVDGGLCLIENKLNLDNDIVCKEVLDDKDKLDIV